MTHHSVVFYSPGTLFPESTSRDVDAPDVKAAVALSQTVTERYSAKPFGFQFVEYLTHPPVPDGRGGTLDVERKEIRRSGFYFITGRLRYLRDVVADDREDERILRDNMRINGFPVVVENTNSWKSTHPFREDDVLLDADGSVLRRGDAPDLVEYRLRCQNGDHKT